MWLRPDAGAREGGVGRVFSLALTDYTSVPPEAAIMAKVNVSISIKDDHLPRFAETVEHLKREGLQVDQALQGVGVITGSIEHSKIAALQQLPSVANVEESRSFQIAPPDSDVQ
jgi:hypothetical protein